jgi:high affinity Mn2+ porin
MMAEVVKHVSAYLLGIAFAFGLADAAADDAPAIAETPENYGVHGQFTYVEQESMGFNHPYSGPNSLTPNEERETTDATLFLGARLWSDAEIWINPEIDQGFGLDDTLGVAGFPSAEAYKVGKKRPYLRLARLFIRNTVNLDGETAVVESDENRLAGSQSINRWVFTVGKFGVVDIFDNNDYAHDPKHDFLNWTAVDSGAFDYAADAWGYSVGGAAEWYQGSWTFRGGVFDLSNVPNSTRLDPGFHEFELVGEVERRYTIGSAQGKVLITAYNNRGRMGLLEEAAALAQSTNTPANAAAVRQYRSRPGIDLNLAQALTPDLGLFARIGKASGNVEAYEFTDVDRSLSAGLSLKGSAWRRGDDKVGFVLINNGISAQEEQYLNAGGLGILVGDGKLPHPGAEQILETFYSAAVLPHTNVSLDYQAVENPGYNRDRGPVSIWAVRIHAEF